MTFDEIKLMEKIQKFNFAEQMRLISTPFNTGFFITMIIVLYIYKVLNFNDVIFLGKGCIINSLLKFLFKRSRPYHASDKIKNYSGKEHKLGTNHYSFPSGHTFAATFFSLFMLRKYPTEFLFNIIAVLVGFSRIFLGVHYPTDIIGGMLFAFIFFQILID
jgi:undecaprenyl-diphosphatase